MRRREVPRMRMHRQPQCEEILADTAASVYIQDLPDMVALNKKFTGYKCYPLYIQDIAQIKLADDQ